MKRTARTLLHYIIITSVLVHSLEPLTSFVVGSGLAGLYSYLFNSCSEKNIKFNGTGLEEALQQKLFGQHIATHVIRKAVTGFMNNENPKKPLVLSLHGWTGTGKNYVSQLIAESVYREGMKSEFVHLFTATAHFSHVDYLNEYKRNLQQWIKGNVTRCSRSMFIFDEMDKMHPGLIDSIKPFLDFYDNLDGVSYRNAIFVFLSNAGGEKLVEVALNFWREGKEREEIKLKDLEEVLSLSVFNNKNSGLWHTSLIDKNLVDFFVPFLPLEYKHVLQCGRVELANKGHEPNEIAVEAMVREMSFFPQEERIFSSKGCKGIASRLDYYL
ncbi:torsin family 1 isoform X1 [Trichomycterus rosablanca]|uniref:torsin family 1 isoform X1 n=1 Tax=Trichomycterus rosablanca TaxID=2290929 RepID=UPI002F35CC74